METVLLPAVDPGQRIIWYYDTKAGTKVLGHRGGDKGVSTDGTSIRRAARATCSSRTAPPTRAARPPSKPRWMR